MSTKQDVQGSFGSLIDTLKGRLDPFHGEEVSRRWIGALMRAAALARATDRWLGLPAINPRYAGLVAALDAASRRLAGACAGSDEDLLAALDRVDAALAEVAALLGL